MSNIYKVREGSVSEVDCMICEETFVTHVNSGVTICEPCAENRDLGNAFIKSLGPKN